MISAQCWHNKEICAKPEEDGHTARACKFVERVGAFGEVVDDGVASLVVGGDLHVLLAAHVFQS